MKSRASLQRRSHTESSEPLIARGQPSPGNPQHEQPQPRPHDFSQVDLFSHAPQRAPIQMKLTIGAPNDQYEQEADRVADQVLSLPDAAVPQPIQRESDADMDDDDLQMKPIDTIQREGLEEEELSMKPIDTIQREGLEEEELAMKPLENAIQRADEEDELQMKPNPAQAGPAVPALETQLNQHQGKGSPLPNEVRSFMEPRFGADFSQVKVHTGAESVQMNQALSAQAFTHKQDIYFGAGKSPQNDALTAHELTHVIQQNGAIARQHADSEAQ